MYRIATSITIRASVDRVWSVLMDFPAYAHWNPFIRNISGSGAPGTKLEVTIEPAGGKAMSFSPRVLVREEGKEFRWRGQVLVPGVFDGEHHFRLGSMGEAATTFSHGETFSGLLVSLLMRGAMRAGTEAGFAAMNEALKARVEGRGT